MSRHCSAGDYADDVDEGRAEVTRHGGTTRTLLDAMDLAVDTMGCDP